MQYKNYYILSAAYGEGTYNTSTYVGDTSQTTTPTTGSQATTGSSTTSGGNSGSLANTGFDLLVGGTVACAIVFVALVIRFSRRKTTNS